MIELKPCPFCGGKAMFYVAANSSHGTWRGFSFGIYCSKCDLAATTTKYKIEVELSSDGEILPTTDERALAAEIWNRRVDND